jgi:hypothetical protein
MTHTKDEALKLALEALQKTQSEGYNLPATAISEAITAIEAALAQPAQEPVSWALQEEDGQVYDCICNEEHDRHEGRYTVPLYTTPQQRPWVGLTGEQRDAITEKVIGFNNCCGWEDAYATAIEAKSKELNQ